MILVNKNVGETPLELLERLRKEKPELAEEKLSYAGRLDPMAEGQMLILVGDEENKRRAEFLGLDKEYLATFLVGVKTDSGDILGLIESDRRRSAVGGMGGEKKEVKEETILAALENIKKIKTQKYPWFSGRAVNGVKLFDHFKTGNTDIERPARKVEIKEVELVNFEKESTDSIKNYIFDSISKVSGDFRQKEILAEWESFFQTKASFESSMQTFQIRILVSSGTFIRALGENFGFPVTLLKLNRTEIKYLHN